MVELTEADTNPDFRSRLIAEEVLSTSATRPIYLSSIEVNGGETFSNEFFKKLLTPLIDRSDYTLTKLVDAINVTEDKLIKTNVFKDIVVSLHSEYTALIPSSIKNYNKETPVSTKVIFDLTSINLNIGEGFLNFNNEENLNLNLDYLNNNFNENAELVNIGVNYNPYKPNDHLITNTRFLANLNNPSFKFLIDLFHSQQNNQSWQQASEGSTGGLIGLQYNKSRNLNILSGLSLARRTIHNIDDAAADELKFFAGDFLKSSLVNQIVYSNLSFLNHVTKNFPTNGLSFVVSNEISSNQEQENPNNHSAFIKSSISVDYFKSFFNNRITTALSTDFGGIYSSSPNGPVHISDRFYLGGVNSFRGFTRNAINTNGGTQFYKLSGTLFASLPSWVHPTAKVVPDSTYDDGTGYEANPLRFYATGAVGNVSDNILEDDSGASSIGFGLRYINYWANFDVGYYFAKRYGTDIGSAGIKDGLHFSVSIGGSNRQL
ncbi:SAM50-like protein [Scheffersomyces xylosifermentans]|uniref:SAM50-like protein n=1 Tax=Scheffersomyces xylosifermentans TaxID=1304137 RepID=UPI00315C6FF4